MLPERTPTRPGRIPVLPVLILKRVWDLLGALKRLLDLLGALERFLGASWTLLGSSGLVLSVFCVHLGSRGRPGP